MFSGDPGLDGCLMEIEEILKLRSSNSIGASLITCVDQGWIVKESIDLPPRGIPLSCFLYEESHSRLRETLNSISSLWCLIQVPSGFDVIDVVLVDTDSPAIYGIQITRSPKPFAKHHTFDTCLPKSKERLAELRRVITEHFELAAATEISYVMLAPNCVGDEFKPPGGHKSAYYFAPTRIITEYDPSKSKKRPSHPVSARPSPLKKEKCCKCISGKCTNCECFKKKRQCNLECHCQLTGDQKVIEADTKEDST